MSKRTTKVVAKELTLAHRQLQAIEMKSEGLTYDQIADAFLARGYCKTRPARRTCIRWVQAAFKKLKKQTTEYASELRLIEDRRLEIAVNAIMKKVKDGDVTAIDQLIRISESRRKLWGTDKASEFTEDGQPVTNILIKYGDDKPIPISSAFTDQNQNDE